MKERVLVIKAQQHRTQEMNKLDAFSRLHELINSVARPPKSQRSETKASRGKVNE